jgi:[acyl-carrier-protein] S-malonyltransferase
MTRAIFMFPSQSARYPGMLEKALVYYPEGATLVDTASRQVQRDLREAGRDFANNRDVQLAGFVTNHLYLLYLESRGWKATLSLGASLGELNHVVHIGALTFEQALRLVAKRGEAYDQGPPGERAVLFPLKLSQAQALLKESSLEVSGHLAPGVILVGGESQALHAFVESLSGSPGDPRRSDQAERVPAVTARFLGVKLPIHSSHFREVGERFRKDLESAGLVSSRRPYLPNALGRLLPEATPEQLVDLLARQVSEPMWWRESLDEALKAQPGAILVEAGPGRTLAKLLQASPQWHPEIEVRSAEAMAQAEAEEA